MRWRPRHVMLKPSSRGCSPSPARSQSTRSGTGLSRSPGQRTAVLWTRSMRAAGSAAAPAAGQADTQAGGAVRPVRDRRPGDSADGVDSRSISTGGMSPPRWPGRPSPTPNSVGHVSLQAWTLGLRRAPGQLAQRARHRARAFPPGPAVAPAGPREPGCGTLPPARMPCWGTPPLSPPWLIRAAAIRMKPGSIATC
jgi:hypothetical protein